AGFGEHRPAVPLRPRTGTVDPAVADQHHPATRASPSQTAGFPGVVGDFGPPGTTGTAGERLAPLVIPSGDQRLPEREVEVHRAAAGAAERRRARPAHLAAPVRVLPGALLRDGEFVEEADFGAEQPVLVDRLVGAGRPEFRWAVRGQHHQWN